MQIVYIKKTYANSVYSDQMSQNVVSHPGLQFASNTGIYVKKLYEPAHEKAYNEICATSKDSDQPEPLCSLISLHWLHVPSEASWLSKEPESLPHWVDVQAGLNICWSHRSYCRFCRVLAHMVKYDIFWSILQTGCEGPIRFCVNNISLRILYRHRI